MSSQMLFWGGHVVAKSKTSQNLGGVEINLGQKRGKHNKNDKENRMKTKNFDETKRTEIIWRKKKTFWELMRNLIDIGIDFNFICFP